MLSSALGFAEAEQSQSQPSAPPASPQNNEAVAAFLGSLPTAPMPKIETPEAYLARKAQR